MYYKLNNEIRIGSQIETFKKLPIGNYLISQTDVDSVLKPLESFKLPSRLYGQFDTERFLKAFKTTGKNMGILFTGLKGSGKTLEAKKLCIESKLPVLVLTEALNIGLLISFLSSINQEVVVLIDEFEKIFDEEKQEQLLPLLDGVYNSKILFVLTSNSMNVSQYIKNRTGRIRYLKHFEGIDEETLTEVIADRLHDKDKEDELRGVLQLLTVVSIDNLISMIDEMNLFDESAKEVLKRLNIQLEHTDFDAIMFIKGKRIQKRIYFNPLRGN